MWFGVDFLSSNLDKQHLPPWQRRPLNKNHLGGISAGQFPQAAVSHRLAPQHLTPLSLLQFILLTANWAKGLRRGVIVKLKGENEGILP